MTQKKNESFEELLKRLEEIVENLEDSTIGLGKSIQLFEEGMKITKQCRQTLDEANAKIEVVMNGTVEPFVKE